MGGVHYDWTTPDYAGTASDLGSGVWVTSPTGSRQATNTYSLAVDAHFVQDITSASAYSNAMVSLYLMAASDTVGLTIFTGDGTCLPTLGFSVVAAPKGSAPAITTPPDRLTVNSGSPAAFTVTASGTSPLAYQWYFNGSAISGAVAAEFSLDEATTNNIGNYTVVVTNLYGCATSGVAALTVIPAIPVIISPPASLTLAVGGGGTFNVTASGINPLSYQWYFNGSAISGATSASFNLIHAAATNAGDYSVVITNYHGGTTSSVAVLTVITPPVLTASPSNQLVPGGGTASLTVAAAGAGPLSYQWFKGGGVLTAATNATLTLAHASVSDSGAYYVIVTNRHGLCISRPALVAVDNPGVLGWGYNGYYGQLGDGTTNHNRWLPEQLTPGMVSASIGGESSFLLSSNGGLWALGANSDGQLGTGNFIGGKSPVFVSSNVVAAAMGYYHSLFLTADGRLWAAGLNYYGELGVETTNILQPQPLPVASNVVAVAAGSYHTLFLKDDGTLWTAGFNYYGQLGDGTKLSHTTPTPVASNVVAVAAGGYHSLFLKSDGTLWSMGFNLYGQLGDGSTNHAVWPVLAASNVVSMAGGYAHSLVVKSDGSLWSMGFGNRGQLGNGSTNEIGLPAIVASNVVTAAAGYYHSLFIENDGTLWTMGFNAYGQLGNGATNSSLLPVQVPGMSLSGLAAGAYANYSLALGAPRAPAITGAPHSEAGGMAMKFTGFSGEIYRVEASTNLFAPVWLAISTNTAGSDGTWQFTDPNSFNHPERFYRVCKP